MDTKIEIIGGVSFNQNIIQTFSLYGKEYNVTLNNGTKIIYKEQPKEREAKVEQDKTNRNDLMGLYNATIIDTKENDVYRLMGCENVTIIADRIIKDNFDNHIKFDSDLILISNRRLSNGHIQTSKNNILKLNKGDLYKLIDDTNISVAEEDKKTVLE